MCYNVASLTRKKLKYARHRGADPADIAELEQKLNELTKDAVSYYHVSGFAHPKLLAFTGEKPMEPQVIQWGLIPSWVKDRIAAYTIANKTLNCRSETMFEKPSFRNSAKDKRCIIYLDAYYEHYHQGNQTFPFHIAMKDGSPLSVAGLWDEWLDKQTGELIRTVSIVTCIANPAIARIQNKPMSDEPRMPVILPKDDQEKWLMPIKTALDLKQVSQLSIPFPENELEYHTVRKILGNGALGNVPEVEEEYVYPQLNTNPSLFD